MDVKEGLSYAVWNSRGEISGVYKDNSTPSVVRNPLLKDVTEEYFGSNEYPVRIDGKVKSKFVALGILHLSVMFRWT